MLSLRKKTWEVHLARPLPGDTPKIQRRVETVEARSRTEAELEVILRVPGFWHVIKSQKGSK